MLSFEEKYDALINKDAAYEGIFIAAVKTTMIFCRPTCTARKPKAENVIFYDAVKDALLHGFRPCKICKPMELPGSVPEPIQDLLRELDRHPHHKISDTDLQQKGVAPSLVRRWFKKHHNMTFHAYQRMMRINKAFTEISSGHPVTHAAFDHGYESLSGFNDSFKSIFGAAPTASSSRNVITINRFTTPLGPVFACATDDGVCLLEFTDRKILEDQFKELQKRFNAVILPGKNNHLSSLQNQLAEYFNGSRKAFTIPLVAPGTDFRVQVWQVLHDIPYGQTVSYQQQAKMLGRPEAVRAVASANGMNRIAILIPCHRVVGSDGKLRGYGGGLARKKWLIEFERQHADTE